MTSTPSKTTKSPRRFARASAGTPPAQTPHVEAGEGGTMSAPATAAVPKPSKQDIVLGLMQRPEGAALAEMVSATGWLPHSTRAVLTGLRKKGHAIVREKGDAGTVYRIGKAG
jgi:hypothetical protein